MADCSLHRDHLEVPGTMYQELASLTILQSGSTLALYTAGGKPGSHCHATPASPYAGQGAELHRQPCSTIELVQTLQVPAQIKLIYSCH